MLMPQLVGQPTLGEVQLTSGIVDTALQVELFGSGSPPLPITSLSARSTDMQLLDYAAHGHTSAKLKVAATRPPLSQTWAEAAGWYYLAYQSVAEQWTQEAGGYKALALTLLKRGDLAAESAGQGGEPATGGKLVTAKSAAASSGSSAWKWWLAGGIGVVLLGTVATVIVVRKRKAGPRKVATMHYARRPAFAPA